MHACPSRDRDSGHAPPLWAPLSGPNGGSAVCRRVSLLLGCVSQLNPPVVQPLPHQCATTTTCPSCRGCPTCAPRPKSTENTDKQADGGRVFVSWNQFYVVSTYSHLCAASSMCLDALLRACSEARYVSVWRSKANSGYRAPSKRQQAYLVTNVTRKSQMSHALIQSPSSRD